MPRYYTYLISSLPALHFATKPPFTFSEFLKLCAGFISAQEFELLPIVLGLKECLYNGNQSTLLRLCLFERNLRNELVKIRAARKHLDPQKYLRVDQGYVDSSIVYIAHTSFRNPEIMEGEKLLDLARWHMLDELSSGHYFDIDCLIIYARKLLILEKWQRIASANKAEVLNEALRGSGNIDSY
ncbi:DUF2764 family protein [bacterium]|nr:MAG: DUF2764 family protein [bacterium]